MNTPSTHPPRTVSGFTLKAVPKACACCGEAKRLRLRPDSSMWCADCIFDELEARAASDD